MGDWGWGIGDWGLGIEDWGLGTMPNPQSPIPNPPSQTIPNFILFIFEKYFHNYIIIELK